MCLNSVLNETAQILCHFDVDSSDVKYYSIYFAIVLSAVDVILMLSGKSSLRDNYVVATY